MGRTIGLISLLVVLGIAILFILGIWGIVPFDLMTLGKAGLTGVILLFTFAFVFAIYGMFFWKGTNGSERKLPSSSKEKAAMDAARKSDF
ncbi:MAG TPA: hypothetical protein VK177_03410 [Flavobacteriales bacterium]|nr:hypothetical protein [Flavobacteriales bacterium]